MMTGRLLIDNIDVFGQYGVYVVEGGWNDLLNLPPLKSVTSNDWQEEDGIEADLSAPVLNSREVTVKFAIRGAFSRFYRFAELISDGAVHEWNCAEIGRTFHLRLVSQANIELAATLGFLSLKFADDYPLEGYSYLFPVDNGLAADTGYSIDDIKLTRYGVSVLKGSKDEVIKMGNVKAAMSRNIASRAGVIYDTQAPVHYKTKDVKLSCLLRATTLAEMWRNYYALCYDLARPDVHRLYVQSLRQEYDCIYKNCSVSEFSQYNGGIWLQFTLTVTFIGGYRSYGQKQQIRLVSDTSIRLTSDSGIRLT